MPKAGVTKFNKEVKELGLSNKTYKDIVETFIDKATTAIVERKARLLMPRIGGLGIAYEKNQFKKKCINYSESLKNRQAILKRGDTPLKYEKDNKGNIISDNGGEPWIVYYMNDKICAWRVKGRRTFHMEDKSFTLKASRGNKRKLHRFIESNILKESFYANDN